MRKDVTAKCYGGDATPQDEAAGEAEGGQEADAGIWQRVSIPQEAFIAALRMGDEG